MIALNPDLVEVEDDGTAKSLDGQTINLRWKMSVPDQGPVAYIRITPQLRDFFMLCHEKNGVVGFEYDFEQGGLNFGLILSKEGTDDGTAS